MQTIISILRSLQRRGKRSNAKTPLGLNKWELDEKLKMADFNTDNRILDEKLREHDEQLGNISDLVEFKSNSVAYNANATYENGAIKLTGLPDTLPTLYTVRFIAPVDYTYGDKLMIGSLSMVVSTLNGSAPQSGAFKAGVVVSMDVHSASGRAFFGQSGGGDAGYGVLPSQTQIQVAPGDASAEVALSNVGGPAYGGTKLVCKQGETVPETQTDGTVYDAGKNTKFTITGLTNEVPHVVRAFAYNAGGEIQTDVNGAVEAFLPKELGSLSECSWDVISAASQSGKASKYWSIGDEKDITLTTGEKLTLQIYGFDHDDLVSGGKAGMTLGLKNLMTETRRMEATKSNANGFTGSEMYSWLSGTLLPALPSDLRVLIKPVIKKTSAGNQSTTILSQSMSLFLFSEVECFGTPIISVAGEGTQYPIFTDNKSRIKYMANGAEKIGYWWERSPLGANSQYYCLVTSTGSTITSTNCSAINTWGVCFGLCI